ncbi:MAG: 30S ribosomal protein S12 methylthiotransferase RimO [Deltaproteobacteria bacterium]|jgi:ribosomal protein S12 methylthiotransferase|nr:30S ribosomal protein S12 methylthiotransferase RimO [Deltaproteobacteria bacterium]
MPKFHIVSLGCSKARVDSEYMVSLLEEAGYQQIDQVLESDLIIINTCSFIEEARVESIDTILNFIKIKKRQKLLVAGCLPQRYSKQLPQELPEVDYFLGTSHLGRIVEVLQGNQKVHVDPGTSWIPEKLHPRRSSLYPATAYLKLSEGCNRQCAFCAIPSIRGRQKSYTPDLILKEARNLARFGVKELNLIAQDLTAWGDDLEKNDNLNTLLEKLVKVEGIAWIRLLYLYPDRVNRQLLELIAQEEKIVPYLDLPVQHISDSVLAKMKRGYGEETLRNKLDMIKEIVPEIWLRTTILTGHPGETEEDFNKLYDFVKETKFSHLGVFEYSPEEGTLAEKFNSPPPEVITERAQKIMRLQKGITKKKMEKMKGKIVEILVEEYDPESFVYIGRHRGQAPEIDGNIYLTESKVQPGNIVKAQLLDYKNFDFTGKVLS